ncbi:MAG: hypothetical protein IT453_16890 [Planctomycetes bacterium]|nr:hypothetical protein [Planctomycetota bacterium]
MRTMSCSLTAFALLATVGNAQSVAPVVVQSHPLGAAGIFLKEPMPSNGFGRVAVADLGADLIQDLVVEADDAVGIVFGGAFAQSYLRLTTPNRAQGAPAFAVVRGASGDRVALATSTGLQMWSLDLHDWAFGKVSYSHTVCADAASLSAADVDGDGDDDLVGLSSAGTTAFVAYNASGSFSAAPTTFSVGGVGRAIQPLKWDNTAGLELAVLRSDGLRVFTSGGTALDSLFAGSTGPEGLLTVLHDRLRDRAAWFEVSGGVSLLRVCGRNAAGAPVSEPALSFGSVLQPTGLASFDGNFDERPDLVVTHRFSHYEIVLQHLPIDILPSRTGSYSFVEQDGVWLLPAADLAGTPPPVETSNATSNAWPAAADLDGDLDIDIAFGTEAFAELRTIHADLADLSEPENRLNPQFDASYEGNLVMQTGANLFDITSGYRISVHPLTATATHLEIQIYAADDQHLCVPDFASGPIVFQYFPLVGLEPSTNPNDPRPILPVTISGYSYETNGGFETAAHLRARLVRIVGGSVVQAWAPTYATFTSQKNATQETECDTWLGINGSKYDFPLIVPTDAPTSGGSYTERPIPPVPPPPTPPTGP